MKIVKNKRQNQNDIPISLRSLRESARALKDADIIISLRRTISPNRIICLNNNI